MKLQNCIFDLYGTLVDIHTEEGKPALWEAMAEEFAALGAEYSPKDLQSRYETLVNLEQERMTQKLGGWPEIHLERVFEALLTEKGAAYTDGLIHTIGRRFRQLSLEYIGLYPGAKELLKALREKGMGVWLLSNAQSMFTSYELNTLGLTDCFDGLYLSSDYGVKKPDPRFFRALLDARDIDPETAIMIGNDGTCDIEGAKRVGLHTLYIRSNISPKEPLPQADYVLEEMDLERVRNILLN